MTFTWITPRILFDRFALRHFIASVQSEPLPLSRAGPSDDFASCAGKCIAPGTTCCDTTEGFSSCASGNTCVRDYDVTDFTTVCCAGPPFH